MTKKINQQTLDDIIDSLDVDAAYLVVSAGGEILTAGDANLVNGRIRELETMAFRHYETFADGWEQIRELTGLAAEMMQQNSTTSDLAEDERELLMLVVGEHSNREIALSLGITERTVTNRLSVIFKKLGVKGRVGATALALRRGIVT